MKKTILIVLCLTLCLSLCACAQESDAVSDGNHSISFVLGATEVFPKINYAACYDSIYNTMYHFSEVSAFVADGNVQLALHSSAKRPDYLNEAKHQQLANQYTQEVMTCLASLSANDPETDILSATAMAAATLHGSGSAQKTLYIISSGLSTAGALNFSSSNLLDADPIWITEELSKLSSVPDLTGIDVIWQGLGQTAGHQQSLDSNARAKLTGIWTAILEAGNPASLTIDPTPLADLAPADGLPACSDVSCVTATLSAPESGKQEEILTADSVIRIDETSVQFLPDQAVLADPEAASEVLQGIAQSLLQTQVPVILAGSTASVGGDGIALSEARAQTIKDALVGLGVSQDQITCVGLGKKEWSLRVNDLDNGSLIEELARLNRAVFLFPADSDLARELGL